MVSKTFLLIALAFAIVLVITSKVVAVKDSASNNGSSEVLDAKHHRYDDHGYYDDGPGGDYNGGCRRDHGDDGHGRYYKGGRHKGGYCRYGCYGDGHYDDDGCKCCKTRAEAAAYKVAERARTHK